ncbi:diguanylate cyclase/phosphodiesterase (GGDEF & EAL domains) with PAS/PAC sensor(s) [Acidisarcina polymorpha]|uniref:diguanylate cyclase n=1 Tax=Acidisarcina polymorpha TaxID=2211140 RepID=A0A2Z5G884_9BACT|nr:diguanylate cyclase [Acidisarcina polymorpha]AXC14914.1 diguanylate cyclase/phosphodiesterase (GGDEF & EAL domains) with PAS/PAC sensor(s) [Acidisarcina polymorpha]
MQRIPALPQNLPQNELERLRVLEETELLDSGHEDEFDNLVRLASVICETPIALVTLVDSQRQWFKASIGMEVRETPREVAFCAHTIAQDDLMLVEDATRDTRFADNPLVTGDPGIRFYAGVPLELMDGVRLGSLCVIDRKPRVLSDAQIEALRLLAEQAVKQISMRRFQALWRRSAVQGKLIQEELRASQGLFHAFMDSSPFLALMKDAEGRIVYYNQRCADRFHISREEWLGKTDSELWPMKTAATLRANDLSVLRQWKMLTFDEEADPGEGGSSAHWRSYKFPFKDSHGQEYVAGLAVDIAAEKYAERQLQNSQRALEEANEKLRALAVTDGLTNLLNRRAFDAALEAELSTAIRYSRPLSLMIIDVDNFKSVNDTLGHDRGDLVLKSVAEIMKKSFRASDTVARFGGEEFSVLLPSTTRQAASEAAERLRLAVTDCGVDDRFITISIGVSTLVEAETWTKEEFIHRADSALYKAKCEGKNQVCLS